jgi:hypothetical protein
MVVARSPMSGDLIPSPTTFVERAGVVCRRYHLRHHPTNDNDPEKKRWYQRGSRGYHHHSAERMLDSHRPTSPRWTNDPTFGSINFDQPRPRHMTKRADTTFYPLHATIPAHITTTTNTTECRALQTSYPSYHGLSSTVQPTISSPLSVRLPLPYCLLCLHRHPS